MNDDTDYLINIHDFDNPNILGELKEYSDVIAPEKSRVFQELLAGKNVKLSVIQDAMDPLVDEVAAKLHSEEPHDEEAVQRLETLLQELGTQL